MPPQTRKTILNRVRKYLRQHPNELKGVRGFHKNRLEGLIQRLDAFALIESLPWNVPDRTLFREIALAAGVQFVRQYPFLYHTPNSLRACFGMPTRTDRKKGRYSSIFYRNEAVERQLRPRVEDLESIQALINTAKESEFVELLPTLNNYIERAKRRRYAEELIEAPESDHSEDSINVLRSFLSEIGFEDLQEASDMEEKQLEDLYGVILAPDLVGKWKDREWWVELKEYHSLKFNSKVVFQVFRYLYHTPYVILASISPLPAFTELIGRETWVSTELHQWGKEKEIELNERVNLWTGMRKTYQDFGRTLELTPRFEALLLALTNEIVTREIGLAGTELRGIEKFLDIVMKFDVPITIMDFDKLLQWHENELPKPLLLLKMDFSEESQN
ncbi:MAG: hypothetical protein ACXABU_07435 [Candidatus Hodarchaeales archaeon]|jgi:hypothetical protein